MSSVYQPAFLKPPKELKPAGGGFVECTAVGHSGKALALGGRAAVGGETNFRALSLTA
jgi:hypothetical protein